MTIPTKAQWSQLKSNANIGKAPWYKTADAAVGPALASVESARAKWKAKQDHDSAGNYVAALYKLHTAFGKFINKKDLSAAGALGGQIQGWMTEVATKHSKLQGMLPALKSQDTAVTKKAISDINPFI